MVSAQSFNPNDIEWESAASGTLHKNEKLTNGEYSVIAAQFSGPVFGIKDINGNWVPEEDVEPMVVLRIYRNDTFIKEIIMDLNSESYIDPNYEVKISTTGFPQKNEKIWIYQFYDPWITIDIQLRAVPSLSVDVTTDKDEYISYDDGDLIPNKDRMMTVKVTVTNNGDAFLKNIDIYLNVGELKLEEIKDNDLHQYFYKLEKGESASFDVILKIPEVTEKAEKRSYILNATVKGYDVKDIIYSRSNSKNITILPKSPEPNYFTINKAIRDQIFLAENAAITITVANGGKYNISDISIADSMNDNFELVSNISLQWYIPLLSPGQEWKTTYSIRPFNVNIEGFKIPSAIANFTVDNKRYMSSSDVNSVIVNGPKIILDKKIDKYYANKGENITVIITMKNVGDIATRIQINDTLPKNVTLIRGPIYNSVYLEPDKFQEFIYVISVDTNEEVQLPYTKANYTDMKYRKLIKSTIFSNSVVINAKSVNVTQTIVPTMATPVTTNNVNDTVPTSVHTLIPIKDSSKRSDISMTQIILISIAIILVIIAFYTRKK